MEHTDLLALLSETGFPSRADVRYAPTSFDPSDEMLSAFPHEYGVWASGARAMRALDSRVVISRLPLWWQMHTMVHAACREVSAAHFGNTPTNPALGVAAIKTLGIDTVITSAKTAEFFAHEISDALERTSWILILEPSEDWAIPEILRERAKAVAFEAHLFPGVPVLEQCEALYACETLRFHASDTYALDIDNAGAFASGGSPVALERYRLPFLLKKSGICRCGKTLLEKRATRMVS